MNKIVSLTERRKKENEMDEDLTVLLKKAQRLKKKQLVEYYGDIILIKEDLEKFLTKEINGYLINKRLIEHSFFCAGIYLAKLITKFLHSNLKSYYVVDFLLEAEEKKSSLVLQKGGDFCLLILIFFPELACCKGKTPQYVFTLGKTFYYNFYLMSENVIGYYLSSNFLELIQIGKNVIQ